MQGKVAAMNVRALSAAEVASQPGVDHTVVTTEAWLTAFAGEVQAYGVFDGDALQAVFAARRERRWGIPVCQDPLLAPHCGLVLTGVPGSVERMNGRRKDVVWAIADFLSRSPWTLISLSFPDWTGDFQPFVWRGFKVVVQYTYQIRLIGRTDMTLLAQMGERRRSQIRNGHKRGLRVEPCLDLGVIKDLVDRTFARQKIRNDRASIHRLLHDFAHKGNSFACATISEGVPVAVTFCVYDKRRAYYLLGGVDERQQQPAAAPMAMFACIQRARELGLEVFDFEGSMVPGIERYFRSFGGDLVPMCRVVKAPLPIELLLKPFKRSLF